MQPIDQVTPRPVLALRVSDLAASRAFYTVQLGFGTTTTPLPTTLVEVTDFSNDLLLLVGPDAGDVTSYLQEPHYICAPNATLSFFCQDLDARRAEWSARGLSGIREVQWPLGARLLVVQDGEGNTLVFTPHSAEEIIELYAQGPQRLQEALSGVSEQDLDLAKAPGEWTMRQIVHHIADGDDLWMHAVKAALVHSGCHYRHDWYTPDNISSEVLDYAGRALEPALLLFHANHEHILQLVSRLPNALKRFVLFAWPDQEEQRFTVQDMLYSQAMHVAIHCDEILEIRLLQQR
jgi:hypothetical protein